MDAYDARLSEDMDVWVEDQLAASPGWAPEHYIKIRQCLEGGPPVAGDGEQGGFVRLKQPRV